MKKTGYAAPAAPAKAEFSQLRIAIVATRWNTGVVESLVAGAQQCLAEWGVGRGTLMYAPGAYEVPLAVELLARSRRYDGVIALGAVIRGDTPHFDFVAGECARGMQNVALRHGLPLGFGVLTVNTAKQAAERAKAGRSNKGYEAAAAMLEMVRFKRQAAPAAGMRGQA